MKPPLPASGPEPEPYLEQSVSAGGAKPSAKAIYEQRKSFAKTAAANGEVTEYLVEHITTFTIERKGGLLTIQDSIRKLKLLDAKGKIWTQQVMLKVNDKAIKLIDIESQEELEHFPLSSVQHLEHVLDACSYASIFALVVKDPDQKNGDIHLFQCSQVPANIICADVESAYKDIKNKKGQKSRPETLHRHKDTIQASIRRAPTTPVLDMNVKERVAAWTNAIEAQNETPVSSPRALSGAQQENSAEMMAFKIHRDVQMLNHALDDIEMFVAMLQKSAEANRELTIRRTSRSAKRSSSKKGKGREAGVGMLELRSRLPPESEFIDVFQKFKYCFNLLAKLKNHIRNPNAVEIVHFLFQPLHIVVHSCKGPEVGQMVQCPLFTYETIDFLNSSMTASESQLLRQLGEFWAKSKLDFPKEKYFPPYVPKFKSGWEPPLPFMESESEATELAAYIAEQADHVHRKEIEWKESGANIEDALKPLSPHNDNSPRRVSVPSNGNEATSAFKQHVQSHVARNQAAQNNTAGGKDRKLCRAMQSFNARNEHELSVELDDLLDVLDDSNKTWWKVQNQNGDSGYVLGSQMLLISSATKSHSPPSSIPPPPPPPTAIQNKVNINIQAVLNYNSMNLFMICIYIHPTVQNSAMVLTKDSSQAEVKTWLLSHGFSSLTIDSLSVLNGAQIFSLTKDELKMICDDEGSRVHSQLLVQKSMPSSATNGVSELDKIMERRRRELS
nr:epidermal growth factor receptor kinase substrate 8-like [Ciona intestinalis]|eukprot:XP_026694557.1 epidermal growth factor receptor kinase substrate 8-like [Ciona intestinalis]